MDAIAEAEAELAGNGRLLVRPSGTESVVRVMAEGGDAARIDALASYIAGKIERDYGK
jgi:phosphoglucosamine mutase